MDLRPLSGKHLLEMCSSLVRYDAKTDILTLSHASVQVRNIITVINIMLIGLARIFYFQTISKEQCIMTTIFHHSHSYTDVSLALFLRIFSIGISRMGHVQHHKTFSST